MPENPQKSEDSEDSVQNQSNMDSSQLSMQQQSEVVDNIQSIEKPDQNRNQQSMQSNREEQSSTLIDGSNVNPSLQNGVPDSRESRDEPLVQSMQPKHQETNRQSMDIDRRSREIQRYSMEINRNSMISNRSSGSYRKVSKVWWPFFPLNQEVYFIFVLIILRRIKRDWKAWINKILLAYTKLGGIKYLHSDIKPKVL